MNVFFTADTHFGHENIRKHCRRPFGTVEEMDEAIISNWNGTVAAGDLVYIIGDFAWLDHSRYLARLKGKKILIKGNHDKMSQVCLRNFTEVHQLLARSLDKHLVVMCHYCMAVWPSSCHGAWHLHGHSHGRIKEFPDLPRCDIGVDVWDFAPVPWEVVKRKLAGRKRSLNGDPRELDENVASNLHANREIRLMKVNPGPTTDGGHEGALPTAEMDGV